jgi:hypothetical protein
MRLLASFGSVYIPTVESSERVLYATWTLFGLLSIDTKGGFFELANEPSGFTKEDGFFDPLNGY